MPNEESDHLADDLKVSNAGSATRIRRSWVSESSTVFSVRFAGT